SPLGRGRKQVTATAYHPGADDDSCLDARSRPRPAARSRSPQQSGLKGPNTSSSLVEAWLPLIFVFLMPTAPPTIETPPPTPWPSVSPSPPLASLSRTDESVTQAVVSARYRPPPSPSPPRTPAPP